MFKHYKWKIRIVINRPLVQKVRFKKGRLCANFTVLFIIFYKISEGKFRILDVQEVLRTKISQFWLLLCILANILQLARPFSTWRHGQEGVEANFLGQAAMGEGDQKYKGEDVDIEELDEHIVLASSWSWCWHNNKRSRRDNKYQHRKNNQNAKFANSTKPMPISVKIGWGQGKQNCLNCVHLFSNNLAPFWPPFCQPITDELQFICFALIGPIDDWEGDGELPYALVKIWRRRHKEVMKDEAGLKNI